MFNQQQVKKRERAKLEFEGPIDFRTVLLNAIKMQALYSNGKIKYVETSTSTN
jgi:hypothetical protein